MKIWKENLKSRMITEINGHAKIHREILDDLAATPPPFPEGRFRGDGIVICGGGVRYFTCAWVCINMLRKLGCTLPIQLWYLGRDEMSPYMAGLVERLGVECVDGREIRKIFPARILNGWEVKPFSLIHSPFERVLLLDADCVAILNPEFLFETAEFKSTGAIFWPDFGRLEPDREIWDFCGIEYRDEPEFESGQLVVDKRRCWKELMLTMHMNEYSDVYYSMIHGDKETFHMGFRKTGKEYSMPGRGIEPLDGTMCQHDFDGRRIFQHRNMDKWDLWGDNMRVDGFEHEDLCFEFISNLKQLWDGNIKDLPPSLRDKGSPKIRTLVDELISSRYEYVRVGYDSRTISFLDDGRIGIGSARCEAFWNLEDVSGECILSIIGTDSVTCHLRKKSDCWFGTWIENEQMDVEVRKWPAPEGG